MRVLTFVVLLLPLFCVQNVAAKTHALLIGVSDYDEDIGLADLKGPANDVRLMAEVLRNSGFEAIRVLTSGAVERDQPTRANILDSFAALAADVERGDLVYIHFSGHGTRQIDISGDEADGFDEVILPSDTKRAAPGSGQIPNAIVDEELGYAVDAIRRQGADVFLVLDACHSGSGLRNANPQIADRFADPAVLGVPSGAAEKSEPQAFRDAQAALPPDAGQFLAFYAAQSFELAKELDFAGDGSGWYGLFTAKLAARLEDRSRTSYRQLFQAVMNDMKDVSVLPAARQQTPSWAGTMIDRQVLGSSRVEPIRQFRIENRRLLAGSVHGLVPNAVVGLYDDPVATDDAILGVAQVAALKPVTASLVPVSNNCAADEMAPCVAEGSLPTNARYARIVALPPSPVITLSRLQNAFASKPLSANARSELEKQLDAAIGRLSADGSARFARNDQSAEIIVSSSGEGLIFEARVAQTNGRAGLHWHPDMGISLDRILLRIAQAERIANNLAAVTQKASILNLNPLKIRYDLQRSRADRLFSPTDQPDPARECGSIFQDQAYQETAAHYGEIGDLKQCDAFEMFGQSKSRGAFDVNVVSISNQFCVSVSHRFLDGNASEVSLTGPRAVCSDCPGNDGIETTGHERLFVVTTPFTRGREALNLQGLIDNCGNAGGERSTATQRALEMLSLINDAQPVRSLGGLSANKIWVDRFSWTVIPRQSALERAGLLGN